MGIDDALAAARSADAERAITLEKLFAGNRAVDALLARLVADFISRVDSLHPALPVGVWRYKARGQFFSYATRHWFESSGVSGWNVVENVALTTEGRWIVGQSWTAPTQSGKHEKWLPGPRPSIEANGNVDWETGRLVYVGGGLTDAPHPLGFPGQRMPAPGEEVGAYCADRVLAAEPVFSAHFAQFLQTGRSNRI